MDALVLMSGGIDSTACAHYFQQRGANVAGVFVDYGHSAANAEREAVKRVASHLGLPLSTLSFCGNCDYGTGEVLGRNGFLILSTLMGVQPTAGIMSLGIHSGTSYYDCGTDFVERIGGIIQSYSAGRLQLDCPFLRTTKSFVYRYAQEVGLPLDLTYSCNRGTLPPCGQCLSCMERNALSIG